MKSTTTFTILILSALALILSACSTTPTELQSARAMYKSAAQSNTPYQAPDSFADATNALKHAEQSFAEEGDANDPYTRALSMKAYRKTQAAMLESRRFNVQQANEVARSSFVRDLSVALQDSGTVERIKESIVMTLPSSVLFKFNKATLMPIAEDRLDKVATALKSQPGRSITIEGHTDNLGSANYNFELSEDRAVAVRNYLITQGVAPYRIEINAEGETEPVASNEHPAGRANNRRVEIIVDASSLSMN